MCTIDNPYRTLGIEPDATVEEIKDAYRKAAKTWHPDVSNEPPAESERRFRLITDAYKHALRNALTTAANARKARQSQANSGGGPHPDSPRYTPPEPSPRQRPCQPSAGYGRRLAIRHIKNEIGIALLALLFLAPVLFIVVPPIIRSIRFASVGPEEAKRIKDKEERLAEGREARHEARREARERGEEEEDPYPEESDSNYFCLACSGIPIACLILLARAEHKRNKKRKRRSRHTPSRYS